MKIFLTGTNGLLGTNLVVDLLNRGYQVVGLVRDKFKYQGPLHPNLELIQGGLLDELSPLLADVDIVIHAAAETRQYLLKYADYRLVNFEATLLLMQAAVKNKVRKFIFVSTTNTIGFGSLNDLGNELKKTRYPFSASFYARSKLEAEEQLLQFQNDTTDVIIVNPGFMIGAYDSKPGSGRIILRGLNKKIILYPPGGRNFVHVKDVSQGIVKSIENGVNGEKYLLVNENLSYHEFYQKLNHLTRQKPLMIKIPKFVLLIMGYGGDVLRSVGIQTEICSVNMQILCVCNFYSNKKSVNELGVVYQPVENAIAEAVKYFG